jgi:tetratricopeptide repeat protein
MVAASAALAVTLLAGLVGAQDADPSSQPHKRYKAQPLNLRKEQLGTAAYTTVGRTRMRSGDCEGALDAFDAALRTTTEDPTLFRDRGLCHEKLGHPYPAIDDYSAYLTAMPEAPDAEGIRQRLARLDEETTGRAPAAANSDDTDVPPVDTSVTVDSGGAPAAASAPPPHDKMEYVEYDPDAVNSSLRRGKGWSLAPFFAEHKWFFSGSSFGDSQTWSENVGAQLRYAIGPHGAFVLEAGYERFNSTDANAFLVSGLTSQLAYEIRVPLDPGYDNQVLLDPGIGYEHLVFEPSDPAFQSASANALVPRGRVGIRHLIQDEAALDFSLDVGVAKWFVASQAGGPDVSTTVLVALNVGVVWGL